MGGKLVFSINTRGKLVLCRKYNPAFTKYNPAITIYNPRFVNGVYTYQYSDSLVISYSNENCALYLDVFAPTLEEVATI
jgi:hypothetical protein